MRKFLVGSVALAALFASSSAFAADSATLTVQANVLSSCGFDLAAYTMDFGTLDPGSAVNVNASTTVGILCSASVAWTMNDVSGAGAMLLGGTGPGTLAYSIAAYATTGTGAASRTLTGTVLATSYDMASGTAPGSYSQVRTLTITP